MRDIQRLTGAMVKLPEDQSNQGDEVVVEVFGNFMATQNAQSRIRALVSQGLQVRFSIRHQQVCFYSSKPDE